MISQAANKAAVSEDTVRPIAFFEGEFPSGAVRLWSGLGDRVWGGKTWLGAGSLLAMTSVEQSTDLVATGLSVTLSGIPSDLIAIAINEARQGAVGRVWIGFCDASWALLAEPELLFSGLLDVPQIEDGSDSCSIAISYESQLIDLQRPREWRYTHESQQQLSPGDRGFEFVTSIQDMDIQWKK